MNGAAKPVSFRVRPEGWTIHHARGATSALNVRSLRTFFARLLGLLGQRSLARGEALLLQPCAAVHSFGMRFPIDVVFVDADWRIVAVRAHLVPWRVAAHGGAHAALELPCGDAKRLALALGDRIVPPAPSRSGAE